MAYTIHKWKKRLAGRADISGNLTHLTKPTSDETFLEIIFKMLDERTIIGSKPGPPGFIVGRYPAVCFQDAPLYSLGQNVYFEQNDRGENNKKKIRYLAAGLSFNKRYCFNKGARPVIYEKTEVAKKFLSSPEEFWRIVNYDLGDKENIIDWTHEREWRVKGDFTFDIKEALIILPNDIAYRKFLKLDKNNYSKSVKGIINLREVFL